jgi:1-deoxy-D-xylulose 5-phosphate reductoisomerase
MIAGIPNMAGPVGYALKWPDRFALNQHKFEFPNLSFANLNDWQKRNVNLSYTAKRENKCIAFTVANELIVQDFLKGIGSFSGIAPKVRDIIQISEGEKINSVDDIMMYSQEVKKRYTQRDD